MAIVAAFADIDIPPGQLKGAIGTLQPVLEQLRIAVTLIERDRRDDLEGAADGHRDEREDGEG